MRSDRGGRRCAERRVEHRCAERKRFLLLSDTHESGQPSRGHGTHRAERFLLLSRYLSISSDHFDHLPIGSDHFCVRFVSVLVVKTDRKAREGRRGDGKRGADVSGSGCFRRVLVANRGEIAVRVIRTCRKLGIETVLTVSDADAGSLPARLADKVIRIGAAPAGDSYLNVDAVGGAAVAAEVDAVHPGYGFLSENARLARACAAAGIVFIGPTPETLEAAGDKLAAREHVPPDRDPVGGEVLKYALVEALVAA